jgi:nucleoside-diphosphate-sugar epimerase
MQAAKAKILLTGGSGFLGKIISETLHRQGYLIQTLGRSSHNHIQCDLAREIPLLNERYDIVIHNAGKAHVVPRNQQQAKEFYDVNVRGTENLLKGLESMTPDGIVFISSVSVYGLSSGDNIDEQYPLAAKDPYGQSKIEAERLVSDWGARKNVSHALLRLPLLAGPQPPGNLGAMIKGIRSGRYFSINGGGARKSIVMAEDVADAIPVAARVGGIYNLTDGNHPTFHELEKLVTKQLESSMPMNLPLWAARLLGHAGDVIDRLLPGKAPVTSLAVKKIVSPLTFNDAKARKMLGWKPRRVIDEFEIR